MIGLVYKYSHTARKRALNAFFAKKNFMNLKNYTTEVPADRSIGHIEKLLVSFGALNIMKEYNQETNRCKAISFIIEVDGMKMPFRLPAETDKAFRWLRKKKPQTSEKTLREQSERIAWKLVHEWIHTQLSMIELEQAEKLQLLFPYLYDVEAQKTYYDRVKENGYRALIG